MIRNSRLSPIQKTVTIRQVAEQAGVSVATVSRVFAGTDHVSNELTERVQKVAQSLNYQPNRIARNLRTQKTKTAALVITDIENPFFTSVVRGAEQVFRDAGFTLLLTNTDEDEEIETQHLLNLRAEGVAGIILAPTSKEVSLYEQYNHAGMIIVAIDRFPKKFQFDRVTVNNAGGVQSAVNHLVEQGHSRIGYIGGITKISTAAERYTGFVRGMEDHQLLIRADWVRQGNFKRDGGFIAMKTILSTGDHPTAVISANNLMTLGALQAIYELGLKIPADIAIVGFDDMAWANSLNPPLTAIAQPTHEMGQVAAQLLLSRISDPTRAYRHVILDTHLILRESSGKHAAHE
jgi:LacI family transcriptional regulator